MSTSKSALLQPVWRWWINELADMLPHQIKRFFRAKGPQHVLHWQEDHFSAFELENGTNLTESQTPLDTEKIWQGAAPIVALGAEDVLEMQASLPLAAEKTLYDVIGFELDRLTPFERTDVYYDYALKARRPDDNKVDVTLFLVKRDKLDALLNQCSRFGVTPTRIDMVTHEGRLRGVNLGRVVLPAPTASMALKFFYLLLIALIVICLFNFWAAYAAEKRDGAALQTILADARARVAQYGAVDQTGSRSAKTQMRITNRKAATPLSLNILNEVTQLLPKESWIISYRQNEDEVALKGEAVQAGELIRLFEASDLFSAARFSEPIVQNPRSGAERFSLSLTLAKKGADT